LAQALARRSKFQDAWTYWESDLARGLLDDLSARQLRPLTAEERGKESDLLGKVQALQEQIGLLEARTGLSDGDSQRLDALRQMHSTARSNLLVYENELATSHGVFSGTPSKLDVVQSSLPYNTALVGWLDVQPLGPMDRNYEDFHWACIVRNSGDPIWVRTSGTGPSGGWSAVDDEHLRLLAEKLRNRSVEWRHHAAELAKYRLEPLQAYLKNVDELVILPSEALAEIPIEALVAEWPWGREQFKISHAPSGSMFARLVERRHGRINRAPAGLLAIGDVEFPSPGTPANATKAPDHGIAILDVVANSNADRFGIKAGDVLLEYNGSTLKTASDLRIVPADERGKPVQVRIWRDGEIRDLEIAAGALGISHNPKQEAAEVVEARIAAKDALIPLSRGRSLEPLPGTRREVEEIANLFPAGSVVALLGERASESALQDLAREGKLKEFQYLHFATHGTMNSSVAMSSALMMTSTNRPPGDQQVLEFDGQITAQQIVDTWELDADLVVLSACETALGRFAGGEGYLGFSQALFAKGARSLVLSLWKVPDRETTLLMTRFYANLLGKREGLDKPMRKVAALHEAKVWLSELTVEEAQTEIKRLKLEPSSPTRGEERTLVATGKAVKPFEHPYHWAAFILIGNPN
jgi:CHAT domain-containing protein